MPPKNKKWQFSLGFYTPIYGHFTFLVLLLFTNRVEYSFDFSWTDFLSLLSFGFLKTNSTINQEASRNISKKPTGSPQKAPRKPPVNYSGAQGRKSVHEKIVKRKKLTQRFLQNSMQLSAFGGPQFQNSMEICHNVDFQLCKKKLWPRLVFIYWCFDSLTLRSVFPVKCWEYCNKAQCCIKSQAQTGECGRLNNGWVAIFILGVQMLHINTLQFCFLKG